MPVEEGRQVPAAAEGGHLLRVDVGELDVPAEADQQTGACELADRRRGHPRPAPQRRPQGLRQPVRSHSRTDRPPQGRAHLLRVGASTTDRDHNPRPASAGGTRPVPAAHRQAATGTRSRPAALVLVV
ncbi:hypothetical protein VR46_44595, partial [Streptomyces sp. NRRL S-444]